MEKFNVSEKLIQSIIFEQSGSIINAIKEAIQNILDAGASIADITITKKGFIIYDNGCGMTKNQIDKYFKIFGESHKRGDDNKIGQYGLGRGQIFKCGYISWITRRHRMLVNAKKHLGYRLKKQKQYLKGTKISCVFYKTLNYSWEYDNLITGIKDYIIPENIKITINRKEYVPEKNIVKKYSNEEFEIFLSNNFKNRIFSQNLFVKKFLSLGNYNILCKKKMSLNIERSNFIESEESTIRLLALMRKMEEDIIIDIKKPDATQGWEILNTVKKGQLEVNKIVDKQIIEIADGSMISINELKNKEVYFHEKGAKADKAIQAGVTVITDNFKNVLNIIKEQSKISFNVGSIPLDQLIPDGYLRDLNEEQLYKASGKRAFLYYLFALEMNKQVFGEKRKLYIGSSDYAEGWTDGFSDITIDWKVFATKGKKSKVCSKIFHVLAHEYAHDEDDTNESAHDSNFYKRYYTLIDYKINKYTEFVIYNGTNKIKEEYESKIDYIECLADDINMRELKKQL